MFEKNSKMSELHKQTYLKTNLKCSIPEFKIKNQYKFDFRSTCNKLQLTFDQNKTITKTDKKTTKKKVKQNKIPILIYL